MKLKKAFTLIEIIFVLIIIGILSIVALPRLAIVRDDAKVVQCLNQITLYMRDISTYYTSQGRYALDMDNMSNVKVFETIPISSIGDRGEYYFVCDKMKPTVTSADAAITFRFSKINDGMENIRTNLNAKVASVIQGSVDGDLGNLLKLKHIASDGLGIDHPITGIRIKR